ncbi:hypothetical protein AAVH_28553 [Aphelenchoides avenae]|nr:hypothetical protein AAVH_28553 [Aphelenchus avenae]
MVLDARDEEWTFGKCRTFDVVAKIEEDSVISNAPAANEVTRGLSPAAQESSSSSGVSYETDDDECSEELSKHLTQLIAISVDRSIRELQRIKATKASAVKFTVKEERSTFDYDATQDLEGSEEKMEMDFFEYDDEEELPQTNGADNAGSFAMCNGYRMRSKHANARGELYWVCARQTRTKCSGSAKSGLDAVDLVEIRKHNHDVDDERLTQVRRGVRRTDDADDGVPQRKIIRCAKADALNRLESAESTANSDESVSKVDALESPRANGKSTSTDRTRTPTGANKTSPIVAESRSPWNFKSREAMRNADVVLHLQDTKLYAHKAVLSAISPVFDEAFRQSVGPIAVHSVDPSGIEPRGLEAFLHSIYPNGSEPAEHALPQVTILAYRYGIRPLLRKCLERVRNSSALSKLDKLSVAIQITDVELEDHVIASFTKDDIHHLLQSDLLHQLGEGRLVKLLAKSASL